MRFNPNFKLNPMQFRKIFSYLVWIPHHGIEYFDL